VKKSAEEGRHYPTAYSSVSDKTVDDALHLLFQREKEREREVEESSCNAQNRHAKSHALFPSAFFNPSTVYNSPPSFGLFVNL